MDDMYEVWARDAQLLAQFGQFLFAQPTSVRVRLPRALADAALAAWLREDEADTDTAQPPLRETAEGRAIRHRAGTLSLIGASIEDGGIVAGDHIVVEVDSWYVGLALEAADDAGLISRRRSRDRRTSGPGD